ncbi:MAG TPA: hypothetical protein VGD50_06005, partial [Candidatus Baltobacteraceae bacterium]
EGHKVPGVRSLPLNLLDATRLFEQSPVFTAAFGDEFVSAYSKHKYAEWQSFGRHLTEWERQHTLDC